MPTVRVMNPAPSRAEILVENRKLRAENEKLESHSKTTNPRKGKPLSNRLDLLTQIRALREENDELQDKLDDIADLASAPEDQEQQTQDDLIDALNDILDLAASDCKDTDEDDEGNQ